MTAAKSQAEPKEAIAGRHQMAVRNGFAVKHQRDGVVETGIQLDGFALGEREQPLDAELGAAHQNLQTDGDVAQQCHIAFNERRPGTLRLVRFLQRNRCNDDFFHGLYSSCEWIPSSMTARLAPTRRK